MYLIHQPLASLTWIYKVSTGAISLRLDLYYETQNSGQNIKVTHSSSGNSVYVTVREDATGTFTSPYIQNYLIPTQYNPGANLGEEEVREYIRTLTPIMVSSVSEEGYNSIDGKNVSTSSQHSGLTVID